MNTDEESGFSQAYGARFAKVYDKQWGGFSKKIAPQIEQLFGSRPRFQSAPRTLLDVCCGTGQLVAFFADKGYRIVGIDLSPHMLALAESNNKEAVQARQVEFVRADAASFEVERRFSFAVSTYDSLNHLPDVAALESCLRRMFGVLESPGLLVFDLNTPKGFQRWNGIHIDDSEETTIINRGIYADGACRAYTSITGFMRNANGTYSKFAETAYESVFETDDVLSLLTDIGFEPCYMCASSDLTVRAEAPGDLGRVFFVCEKP